MSYDYTFYSSHITIDDAYHSISGAKLSSEEKETIEAALDEQIKWLEKNQDADVEDFKSHKKALEEIVQPIISKLYKDGAPPTDGAGAGGEEEEKDEL